MYLAMLAMKDMKWRKVLEGDDKASVISSFHDERESLLSTVLTLVEKDDAVRVRQALSDGCYWQVPP